MRIELLKSTMGENAARKQHLACFIINDRVAIDAGSLAQSCNDVQRSSVRDIVLTHAHLDHVAGLPLFIDDLFSTLTSPIRIHACREVIEALECHIFNWEIFPRFSALRNSCGAVLEYLPIVDGQETEIAGLRMLPVPVNHKVPSSGFVISEGAQSVAFSGDTAAMDQFWTVVNDTENLSALLIECAFPNSLRELAEVSHHMTPFTLRSELQKFRHPDTPIYVINMKPMFSEVIVGELDSLEIENLRIFEPGKDYIF